MFNITNLSNFSDKKIILVIVLIFAPLFMFYLGVPSFWEEDDSVRGEISREMFVSGNFIDTYFNYEFRFDKPPFIYWINSISYGFFGVNEFSSRLGSTMFFVFTLILLYFFGKKLFDKKVAIMSVLILGSTFFYFVSSQLVSVDAAFIFFITLTLYFFYSAYTDKRYKKYISMGASLGLGTLVKGPVIFILVGLIIFIFWLFEYVKEKQDKKIFLLNRYLWLGILLAILIPSFWYLIMIFKHHNDFIDEHFIYRMIERFTIGIEGNTGPWYYYLLILFAAIIPWSWFIINTILLAWHKKSESKFSFLLIWVTVIFIFFTIAQTKLPNYILPLIIPLAVLIAFWWEEFINGRSKINWLAMNLLHLFLAVIFGYLALKYWSIFSQDMAHNNFMILMSNLILSILFISSLVVNNIAIMVIKKYNKNYSLLFNIIFVSGVFILISVWVIFSLISDQFKPAKYISKEISRHISSNDLVISAVNNSKGLPFYLRRPVIFSFDNIKIAESLSDNRRVFIMIDQLRLDYLDDNNINYYLLSEYGIGYLISNYPK